MMVGVCYQQRFLNCAGGSVWGGIRTAGTLGRWWFFVFGPTYYSIQSLNNLYGVFLWWSLTSQIARSGGALRVYSVHGEHRHRIAGIIAKHGICGIASSCHIKPLGRILSIGYHRPHRRWIEFVRQFNDDVNIDYQCAPSFYGRQ